MAFEKILNGTISSVATQLADLTMPSGGVSTYGATVALTSLVNPFRGYRALDNAAIYIESPVNDGVWTVTVHGTVLGTSFPVAQINMPSGYDGASTVRNLAETSFLPTPTAVTWDYVSGNGITATVNVVAKVNRGIVRGQYSKQGSDKVVETCIFATGASTLTLNENGINVASNNYLTNGISEDTGYLLVSGKSVLVGNSTYATYGGLEQMEFWDHCNYYLNATGFSGSWIAYIQTHISGKTIDVARCNFSAATAATGITKKAFQSLFNGPSPKPTRVYFDLVTAGTSAYFSGNIYAIAKASRGNRSKV